MSTQKHQIHHLPQSSYIDSIRYLPPLSPFTRHIIVTSFNSDTQTPLISLNSLSQTPPLPPTLTQTSTFTPSSRITSLKASQNANKPIIAASTRSGAVHVLFVDAVDVAFESEVAVNEGWGVGVLDLLESGEGAVCVGEDGNVNVVSVGEGRLDYRRVFDGKGLVSFSAVKWGSNVEFATGGYGNLVQWWDQRRPGGPVLQLKGNWAKGANSGIIHSVDIHPSRKHTCLAGGSYGTVFAWDLRRPQQPIVLSGIHAGETTPVISESDVWEVQYDTFMSASSRANISSEKVLPAMICSEDGILAVIKQGEEPSELLAENCAINSFDIDRHNPADVICSLEWESIAILTRA